MSIFESNSLHLRKVLIFCFNLKSGDFDVEDRHGGGKEKICEDSELEALLADDSCQKREELAESLGVTRQAISKRLKAMGMI